MKTRQKEGIGNKLINAFTHPVYVAGTMFAVGGFGAYAGHNMLKSYVAEEARESRQRAIAESTILGNTPVIVDNVVIHNGLNGQSPYAEMFFRQEGANSGYHAQVPEKALRESAYRIFTNDIAQGAESRMAVTGSIDDVCTHGYQKARDVQVEGLEDIE